MSYAVLRTRASNQVTLSVSVGASVSCGMPSHRMSPGGVANAVGATHPFGYAHAESCVMKFVMFLSSSNAGATPAHTKQFSHEYSFATLPMEQLTHPPTYAARTAEKTPRLSGGMRATGGWSDMSVALTRSGTHPQAVGSAVPPPQRKPAGHGTPAADVLPTPQ